MRNKLIASCVVFVLSLGTCYILFGNQQTFGAAANISTTATSTLKGLNISSGCLTINGGPCVGNTNATSTRAFATLSTSNGIQTTATAACPSGKTAVGGGVADVSTTGYYMTGSHPDNAPPTQATGWTASVECNAVPLGTCSAGTLTVYAMCVTP